MNLVASVIVRNELGRYLEDAIGALLEYVDEIRIVDCGSTDGTYEWLLRQPVSVLSAPEFAGDTGTFSHEGRARQRLLEWTLAAEPTHILSIDGDEFVADGRLVRHACLGPAAVLTLEMLEVWELDGDCICVRADGGWRPHPVPILYRGPTARDDASLWRIADRALACGREPLAVRQRMRAARSTGTEILHFGWANQAERAARHARYAAADGGRFHQSGHLDSILWGDDRVTLDGYPWPAELEQRRPSIAAAAGIQPMPDVS
jgi:hypothetical protein